MWPVVERLACKNAAPSFEASERALFVAWKAECFRSTQTAHVFGADLALLPPLRGGLGKWAPVRAVLLMARTVQALSACRPDLLIVLNQPAPLAAMAWLYTRLAGAKLVLDSHSKIYQANFPSILRGFYKWLTPRVWLNINHNGSDCSQVEAWGGRSLMLEALPFISPIEGVQSPVTGAGSYIFCVCSFAADEPTDQMLEAMRLAPELCFLMSGRPPRALQERGLPLNLTLTGYLDQADYYNTLNAATAVATFSTREWIMQMAVEEALLFGVPVVTNRSSVLEAVVGDGGEFVDLTPEDIARGFRRAVHGAPARRRGMMAAAERQRRRVLDALELLRSQAPLRPPHTAVMGAR